MYGKVWKPNRDVYVSWHTVGGWLSVGGVKEVKEARRGEGGEEEGRGGEEEGKKSGEGSKGKKETKRKDVQEAKTAHLAAARVRP